MIKLLFFLIAIANLSFFLWAVQYGSDVNTPQSPTAQKTLPTILLVSEAPATNRLLYAKTKPEQNPALPDDSTPPSESVDSTSPEVTSNNTTQNPTEPNDEIITPHTPETIAETTYDFDPHNLLKSTESNHTDSSTEPNAEAAEKTARSASSATDKARPNQTAEAIDQSETEQNIFAIDPNKLPSKPAESVHPVTSTEITTLTITKLIAEKTAEATTTDLTPDKTPEVNSETLAKIKPKSAIPRCTEKQTFISKQAALEALPPHLDASNILEIEQNIPSRYLVFIPAAKDFGIAQATEQQLKAKGITNLWLFRKGPMKNAISLGLFVKKQRAENLAQQLKQKQIEAEIQTRYKSIKRWRIDVKKTDCSQQSE